MISASGNFLYHSPVGESITALLLVVNCHLPRQGS